MLESNYPNEHKINTITDISEPHLLEILKHM